MSKNLKNKEKALIEVKRLKAEKFFKSLNFEKRQYVLEFAELKNADFQDRFLHDIDLCTTAAIVETFEDLSFEEIKNLCERIGELYGSHIKTIKERGNSMAKLNKIQDDVRVEVNKLLENGLNQKKSVEELKIKFPLLSIAELTNAYKKVKEEFKSKKVVKIEEGKKEISTEEAVKYIFSEEPEYKIPEEIKAEVKDISKESNLKVLSKEIIAVGTFGEYKKNEKGVTVKSKNITFGSIKDVRKRTEDEIEKIKKQIENLKIDMDNLAGIALEVEEMFSM